LLAQTALSQALSVRIKVQSDSSTAAPFGIFEQVRRQMLEAIRDFGRLDG
jgi:hypothetical protein